MKKQANKTAMKAVMAGEIVILLLEESV